MRLLTVAEGEDEAAVIRRIFSEYAAGLSARAIAAGLNRDGIPSPRGGAWGASSINGSRSRASGILYNEAYIGRLVYNRTTFSKDPESGRRVSRPRSPADRRERGDHARRIAQLGERIRRLVDEIADGLATRATRGQLIADKAERERLEQDLTRLGTRAQTAIELHPRAIARYQQRVAALTEALRDTGSDAGAAALSTLRGLVDRIDITPLPARGAVALTAHGLIAGLVDYATRKQAVNGDAASMVAGEGFEPQTLGL
ncbi:MAG: recombinase family protein [Stellaceae bacterium]